MSATKKKTNIGSKNRSRQADIMKLVYIVVLIIIQAWLFVEVYCFLQNTIIIFKLLSVMLSGMVVLYLINKQENPAYKLAWIVLVLSFPLIGGSLYVLLAGNRTRKKFIKECLINHQDTFNYVPDDSDIQAEIKELSKSASVQSTYISSSAGYPVYLLISLLGKSIMRP